MEVKKLQNGQYEVRHENLILTQMEIRGKKYNECGIDEGDYIVLVSQHDERFKPLFIALHNFKISE